MNQEAIMKGFKNTGIYPIDPTTSKLQRTGPSIIFNKCECSVGLVLFCFVTFVFRLFWGGAQVGQFAPEEQPEAPQYEPPAHPRWATVSCPPPNEGEGKEGEGVQIVGHIDIHVPL